jgi:hypothetical protein
LVKILGVDMDVYFRWKLRDITRRTWRTRHTISESEAILILLYTPRKDEYKDAL